MILILLDDSGDKYIDTYRGKLTSDPANVEIDRMTNIAIVSRIKTKIAANKDTYTMPDDKAESVDVLLNHDDIASIPSTSTKSIIKTTRVSIVENNEKLDRPTCKKKRKIPSITRQNKIDQDQHCAMLTTSKISDVKNTLSKDEPVNKELVTVQDGKVKLKRHDFLTLCCGKWLNDEIIQSLFWKHRKRDHESMNYYMTAHFMTKLQHNELNTYNYQFVRKWTKNVDIFCKKQIFIPVNIHGQH